MIHTGTLVLADGQNAQINWLHAQQWRPSPYVPRDQAVRDAGEGPRRNVLICTFALELRLQYGVGRPERRYRAWS